MASTPSRETWSTSWPTNPRREGFEREPVVRQQPLRDTMGGHCLVEDDDGVLDGLTGRDMGRHRVTGVIVDELEDHALPASREDVLGGVELPARVRCGVDEPAPRRARPLAGLGPRDACLAEDPRQRRRRRHDVQAHRLHLLVHADRNVIEAGCLQGGADRDRLVLDLLAQRRRARPGATRPGSEHRGRALCLGALAQLVEGLAGDAVLGTARGDRATGARHLATGRSRDGHEDRWVRGRPPPKPRGRSVTTKTPRSVTDVLMQFRHRCLET